MGAAWGSAGCQYQPLPCVRVKQGSDNCCMHTLEQLRSGALAGTRRLDLSCGLREVPPQVFDLADSLEVLNLTGNQLHSLPHDLPRLHRLRIIFCSDNAFTELPEVLGDCAALQVVGFKANRITHVPAAALPAALRWLILTDNAIAQLPAALGQRAALQKLMLAGNRLNSVPDSLADASRLEMMRLSANRLTHVPAWLTALPRLSWLALAGNPLGWHRAETPPIATVAWQRLQVDGLLGEGASGHIYRVHTGDSQQTMALKLFKAAVTSDGLPEQELAACLAAGQHPALCTPLAALCDHPQGAQGLLLPLIPPRCVNLAGPPSLDSCTRDVYAPGLSMAAPILSRLALGMAQAVAHLHQRGVMHGDLYAHNILWDPGTGQAMLSDFGGASLLPLDQPALCRALLSLEVRAFGCLLEELLACAVPDTLHDKMLEPIRALAQACLQDDPTERPDMVDVVQQLRGSAASTEAVQH